MFVETAIWETALSVPNSTRKWHYPSHCSHIFNVDPSLHPWLRFAPTSHLVFKMVCTTLNYSNKIFLSFFPYFLQFLTVPTTINPSCAVSIHYQQHRVFGFLALCTSSSMQYHTPCAIRPKLIYGISNTPFVVQTHNLCSHISHHPSFVFDTFSLVASLSLSRIRRPERKDTLRTSERVTATVHHITWQHAISCHQTSPPTLR